MLRPILLGLSLLVVLLAAAACQAGPSNLLTGSGTVRSEARPVGALDEVELAGVGTLTITQGPQESLTVEAEDNLLPQIRGEVRGRRLVLGPDGGKSVSLRPTRPIRYIVTVRDLTAIELAGAGRVEITGLTATRLDVRLSGAGTVSLDGLAADDLTVALSGLGDATASGTVGRQEVTLSGAGSYRAERLASREARVTASGAGDATVRVSDALSVKASGAGTVEYIGDPAVDQETSATGRVKRRAGR
jgi:hypothetical protein